MSSGIPVTDEIQGNLNIRDFSGTGLHGNLLVENNLTVGGQIITGPAVTPGTDITTILQNAITKLSSGGVIELPAGTFTISTALQPVSFLRITGQGARVTKLKSTVSSVIDAGASLTDTVEIDHLTLDATGSDIITGANVERWRIHDCQLTQHSAGNAIWNAPSASLMIECIFERNTETVSGATRTVEAWFLSGSSGADAVNQNKWRDNVCTNSGNDTAEYWYHLQNTGSVNLGNSFENVTFEHPYGGMIWLESCSRSLIAECFAYDATGATISNHLIQISKNSGGLASARNTIINAPRASNPVTFASNIGDISLDANCNHTTLIAPQASGDLVLYLNGSTGVKLINLGAGSTIHGGSATAAAAAGAGTSPPSPVVNDGPTNECGNVTFGTGTSPAAGNQVNVTFGTPFNKAPTVIVVPAKTGTVALGIAPVSVTGSGFTLATASAPAASQGNTVYSFNWYAVV